MTLYLCLQDVHLRRGGEFIKPYGDHRTFTSGLTYEVVTTQDDQGFRNLTAVNDQNIRQITPKQFLDKYFRQVTQ
jgi:hypothetical protein